MPDILEEHFEEVAFLSIQRRKLLFSPEIPLRRFRVHEARIEAHLDGLRVGGETARRIAEPLLEQDDPWLVYAAARIWLEQATRESVLDKLTAAQPKAIAGWKEAFRQLPAEVTSRVFSSRDLPPKLLAIAADAWGWHGRLDLDLAHILTEHSDVSVRRSLARHLRFGKFLPRLLEDTDAMVRRSALWSLALADGHQALARARARADAFGLRVLGLFGDATDAERIMRGEPRLAVLQTLGDLGQPKHASFCLEFLKSDDEELRDAATSAHTWLTTERPAEEPMFATWRSVLSAPKPELAWLRREVPDGFFSGVTTYEALPGE